MTEMERREEKEKNEELINDEIYLKIEEAIDDTRACIEHAQSGSQEREREVKNLKMLIDAREQMRQTDMEKEDKEERRRIEEKKNDNNANIEAAKARKSVRDYIAEYGQIAFKGAISLAGSLAILAVILQFEENGTLHSKPGRDFRFMNPFQFKF